MSKNPLTSHSTENVLRYSNTIDNKAFLRRASKEPKFTDLKSPLKTSITSKTSLNSPVQAPPKLGYAWMHLKSPTEKSPGSVMVSTDNFEAKENCSFETRQFSSPKKGNKRSFATLYSDKSLTLVNKPSSSISQQRGPQLRSPGDKYESLSNKKTKKSEMGSQVSLSGVEKDIKGSLIGEPGKKSSLPMNLKLTIEKICAKGGSSTHRGHVSPSPSESSSKFGTYSQKKSSRVENKRGQDEKSRSNSKAKCKLNTLLTAGVNKSSADQNKKFGKLSFREVSSVNGTPRHCHNEVYSIEDKGKVMRNYNGLLGILKDKSDEIKKLGQNRSELQLTLGSGSEEVKSVREVQGKTQTNSPNYMKGVYLYRKDNRNTGDKASKVLSASASFKGEVRSFSDRSGKSWITAIGNSKALVVGKKEGGSNGENAAGQRNETFGESVYLKTIDEEFSKQKMQYNNIINNNTVNTMNSQRSKERETNSVDEGALRRGSSHDVNVGERKGSLKEGLDIGGALNELKNRIERLLKKKSKEDSAKTNMIYQSLREHLQKVT